MTHESMTLQEAKTYLRDYAQWVEEHPGQQPPLAMRERYQEAESLLSLHLRLLEEKFLAYPASGSLVRGKPEGWTAIEGSCPPEEPSPLPADPEVDRVREWNQHVKQALIKSIFGSGL
jgi:hypothetical protein